MPTRSLHGRTGTAHPRRTLLAAGILAWTALTSPAIGKSPSWAFAPVLRPTPPAVTDTAWGTTTLDRFVLARLEDRGWQPAPQADRRTLLRRLSFDVTGLPPTAEDVGRFLADGSPDAWEREVDRLLASPRYGERWGRHWLDVARYADNKGYVFFEERTYPWAWTYRDYVVHALNRNVPFDQFIRQQVAADLLPGLPNEILAALGFLTVGDHFSNNTHDILDDRIDVLCRGFLGLTVGCARCHDHKSDPITQADYYSLYGILRSSTEPIVPPPITPQARSDRDECFRWELAEREQRLREFVASRHGAIVTDARQRIAQYLLAAHAQRGQPTTESFMLIADPGDLNPTVISRWRRRIEDAGPDHRIWGPWNRYASGSASTFAAVTLGVVQQGIFHPRIAEAFGAAPPRSMEEVANRYEQVLLAAGRTRTDTPPAEADGELHRELHGPEAPPDVPLQMDWGFLSLLPDRAGQAEFQKRLKDLEQWLMTGPEAPPRAMVLEEMPVPYEPRIFERGNPGRRGAAVPRRFLDALGGRPFQHGSGRRELADAIADRSNPLTARVIVNRLWLHHFGAAIVPTPSDFGNQGQSPSHPELLDWLAVELMNRDWDLKHIHRLILTSATYQQSSNLDAPRPGSTHGRATETDPTNRLLWKMNRRRHDFETQRDALLAAASRLDLRLGGPPVDPAIPRRALYLFVNRLDLPPEMGTFDFPSPASSCPQRSFTTVPAQALYLMNHSSIAECARNVLQAIPAGSADPATRVRELYAHLYQRSPSPADLERAARFLGPNPDQRCWEPFTQALLLANEFAFVD